MREEERGGEAEKPFRGGFLRCLPHLPLQGGLRAAGRGRGWLGKKGLHTIFLPLCHQTREPLTGAAGGPKGLWQGVGGLGVPVQEREMAPGCRTGLCGNNDFRCGWKLTTSLPTAHFQSFSSPPTPNTPLPTVRDEAKAKAKLTLPTPRSSAPSSLCKSLLLSYSCENYFLFFTSILLASPQRGAKAPFFPEPRTWVFTSVSLCPVPAPGCGPSPQWTSEHQAQETGPG